MAIKGKSKPRARRSVTPGPRPVYVPVRRPLVRRRGLQLGVLAVVLLVAAGAIVYGFVHERNANHQKALARTMKAVMTDYSGQVQSAIASVGQQAQLPTAFTLLPQLRSEVQGLRTGSVDPKTASKDAKSIGKLATDAADALAKIDPAGMVRGKGLEDREFVLNLVNARFKMENGLRMEAHAADLLGQAAATTGDQAQALLGAVEDAIGIGEKVFADGYTDWVNAQFTAKTFQPTVPSGAGS